MSDARSFAGAYSSEFTRRMIGASSSSLLDEIFWCLDLGLGLVEVQGLHLVDDCSASFTARS